MIIYCDISKHLYLSFNHFANLWNKIYTECFIQHLFVFVLAFLEWLRKLLPFLLFRTDHSPQRPLLFLFTFFVVRSYVLFFVIFIFIVIRIITTWMLTAKKRANIKMLRTVPTIVIAHTFCADTRISYRRCLLIQGYFARFKTIRRK